MSLSGLKRFLKLKNLSAFSIEKLITDYGLYESAVINLKPIECFDDDEPHIDVSDDVKVLQKFLIHSNAVMLPCSECEKEMAFFPVRWGNPRNSSDMQFDNNIGQLVGSKRFLSQQIDERTHTNVFDITEPIFQINNPQLVSLNKNDMELLKKSENKERLLAYCIKECRDYFLKYAIEIRRDYVCSFDANHRVFVNFRIYDPITPDDIVEYGKRICEGEDDATSAYEYLQDCLIIQKVGQYPSLSDMQMFNVRKYRAVLNKDSYADITKAIGLRADGIGCGSFLYLRRLFEKLVEENHIDAQKKESWDEQAYHDARFNERVQLLESAGYSIIPDELNDVKTLLWGALSKGVHQCTDDECLEVFPSIYFAIQEMLEEKISRKDKEKRINKLKSDLNNI